MKAGSKSRRLFETMHKLKQLNLPEKLNAMPKSEFFTLGTILKCPHNPVEREMRVCDIANELKISTPAVSRNLKNLEEKGYIKRVTNEDDRRNTNVIVTQKGKDAFYHDMETMSNFMERTLNHLEDDETDAFIFLLNKLHNGMQEEILKMAKQEIPQKKCTEKDTIHDA
ncbi:MAG: transcriptional regulator [Oscillospiraceae bacterium]